MKIYTKAEAVPAVAITLATRKDNIQPILFTSQYGNTDTYKEAWQGRKLEWVVNYAKVTLLRDWSTSQAQVTLTTPLLDRRDPIPNLPEVGSMRGGDFQYLSEEDEIRIYMGYVQTRHTPITADMLDEYPCDYYTQEYLQAMQINEPTLPAWKMNPNKCLCPVFWGFIDTINFTGSAKGGAQITLLCRDRTRVFSGTRLVSMHSLMGSARGKGATGLRRDMVIDVTKAATGQIFSTGDEEKDRQLNINAWKNIELSDRTEHTWKDISSDPDAKSKEDWLADPSMWSRYCSLCLMSPSASPRFHLWLQRPPLNKSHGAQIFNAINVNPLEVLGFLARSEERVTDFYSSHINGDFIMGPRALDISGFYDDFRMRRTYFFRDWPCGMSPPPDNQKIISLRVISSSVASFNRYVISSSEPNGTSQSFINGIQIVLSTSPYKYKNRSPSPPCRTQIVVDGNLTAYENPVGGALALALATAQAFGRDSQGVEFKVIGDPTFYPGEAVRIYNTVLHDHMSLTHSGTKSGLAETRLLEDQKGALGSDPNIKRDRGLVINGQDKYADLLSLGTVQTDKANNVFPVYMIRNIQHIFSSQGEDGFVTRIKAAANYNL